MFGIACHLECIFVVYNREGGENSAGGSTGSPALLITHFLPAHCASVMGTVWEPLFLCKWPVSVCQVCVRLCVRMCLCAKCVYVCRVCVPAMCSQVWKRILSTIILIHSPQEKHPKYINTEINTLKANVIKKSVVIIHYSLFCLFCFNNVPGD